eukprot:jgi/Botrbrau1/4087/Bobra.152_3s0038.1
MCRPSCAIFKPGQRQTRLESRLNGDMITKAAVFPLGGSPNEVGRVKRVEWYAQHHLATRIRGDAEEFKMRMKDTMMQVEARVLDAPKLLYRKANKSEEVQQPMNGTWNLKESELYKPVKLRSYGLAAFPGESSPNTNSQVRTFYMELMDMLSKLGMQVAKAPPSESWPRKYVADLPEIVFDDDFQHYSALVQLACEKGAKHFGERPQIVFVIIDGSVVAYDQVKRASDSFLGIPSQCLSWKGPKGNLSMKLNNARMLMQYCANVGMKVNAKLGGTNTVLQMNPFKTLDGLKPMHTRTIEEFGKTYNTVQMVVGADVSHPSGKRSVEPSLAALVASLDSDLGQYTCTVNIQGPRVEIIQDLKEMMKKHLIYCKEQRSQWPERIIFYRDGVSEGQFEEVKKAEATQVLDACGEVWKNRTTLLTYIVVQKRHHTRFFLEHPSESNDPNPKGGFKGNVDPGTVVDKGVVHPFEYDFFLASHAAMKGTSRPSHYHVIVDQNDLPVDTLQKFTYHMCYLFCRCTRAVSVCPPAYYAHRAAMRGRQMVHTKETDSDNASVSSGGSDNPLLKVTMAKVHDDLMYRMYYI